MKIYIHYKITDDPWGGGNSFLKALKNWLQTQEGVSVTDDINDDYDIFLMNGGHQAPGEYIDLTTIKKKYRPMLLRGKCKLVYRLDGFRTFYGETPSEMDDIQLKLLKYTDHLILQSQHCLDNINNLKQPVPDSHFIVLNGVNQKIFTMRDTLWNKSNTIKILACSWSSNIKKGQRWISETSQLPHVSCTFIGNWNKDIPQNNVTLLPAMKQEDLATQYRQHDLFMHLAENDPCPNVILEALSSGLPVLYHQSGGSPEIATGYGVGIQGEITSAKVQEALTQIKKDYFEITKCIRQNVKQFSIESAAKKYLDIFKSLIQHG